MSVSHLRGAMLAADGIPIATRLLNNKAFQPGATPSLDSALQLPRASCDVHHTWQLCASRRPRLLWSCRNIHWLDWRRLVCCYHGALHA